MNKRKADVEGNNGIRIKTKKGKLEKGTEWKNDRNMCSRKGTTKSYKFLEEHSNR
jgi:hypothetical protein